MTRSLQRIFIAHPASVHESYFEHMRFAGRFSLRLFGAAGAALVHAIIPCLFEKTASQLIKNMARDLETR